MLRPSPIPTFVCLQENRNYSSDNLTKQKIRNNQLLKTTLLSTKNFGNQIQNIEQKSALHAHKKVEESNNQAHILNDLQQKIILLLNENEKLNKYFQEQERVLIQQKTIIDCYKQNESKSKINLLKCEEQISYLTKENEQIHSLIKLLQQKETKYIIQFNQILYIYIRLNDKNIQQILLKSELDQNIEQKQKLDDKLYKLNEDFQQLSNKLEQQQQINSDFKINESNLIEENKKLQEENQQLQASFQQKQQQQQVYMLQICELQQDNKQLKQIQQQILVEMQSLQQSNLEIQQQFLQKEEQSIQLKQQNEQIQIQIQENKINLNQNPDLPNKSVVQKQIQQQFNEKCQQQQIIIELKSHQQQKEEMLKQLQIKQNEFNMKNDEFQLVCKKNEFLKSDLEKRNKELVELKEFKQIEQEQIVSELVEKYEEVCQQYNKICEEKQQFIQTQKKNQIEISKKNKEIIERNEELDHLKLKILQKN